jgi:hypothetical protein
VKSESFDDIFAEYLEITYRALDMKELLKAQTKGSYGIVCKAKDKRTENISEYLRNKENCVH